MDLVGMKKILHFEFLNWVKRHPIRRKGMNYFLGIIIFTISLSISGCTQAELEELSRAITTASEEISKSLDQQKQYYQQTYPKPEYTPTYPSQQSSSGISKLSKEEEIILNIKNAITPSHPKVRTFALRLARNFPGEYNVGQVCAIWYYVKKNWKYVNDPRGMEYFAPAYESIEAGLSGDCDDFAILLASLIEAIGGSSRVILAQGSQIGHAYCEVYIGKDPKKLVAY
jgi:transglutaminase-like putative cysteine protease